MLTACEFSVGSVESGVEIEGFEIEYTDGKDVESEESAALTPGDEIMLASEDAFPLRASFLSDMETFVYHFNYDGNQMALVGATQFEGASQSGVSFYIYGGGQITSQALWTDDVEKKRMKADPVQMGAYEVFRSNEVLEACVYDYATVSMEEEVLQVQLKVCEGEDAQLSMLAFNELLNGMELELL